MNMTESLEANALVSDLSESVWPQGLIEAGRLIAADSESRAQGQRRRCSAGNAASRKASGARGPCVSLWPTAEQVKRSDGPELTESRWRSGLQESRAASGLFAKFTSLRPHARSPEAKTWLFQEKVNVWITRKHLRRISNVTFKTQSSHVTTIVCIAQLAKRHLQYLIDFLNKTKQVVIPVKCEYLIKW